MGCCAAVAVACLFCVVGFCFVLLVLGVFWAAAFGVSWWVVGSWFVLVYGCHSALWLRGVGRGDFAVFALCFCFAGFCLTWVS